MVIALSFIQCYDAVGCMTGRASSLQNTWISAISDLIPEDYYISIKTAIHVLMSQWLKVTGSSSTRGTLRVPQRCLQAWCPLCCPTNSR